MRKRPWTSEDDAQIRALMPADDSEIGLAIGRTKDAVRQRRVTLGLRHRPLCGGRVPADDDNWQEKAAIASHQLLEALRSVQ